MHKADDQFLAQLARKELTIAVLGLGYVGLPTALGFAELGWKVIGADVSATRIAALQKKECPFFEPGVDELLEKHLGHNFVPTTDVESAIRESAILFLCVGTPQRANGEADLQAIEGLARTIARNLNGYKLIIEKSTVPAITGHWVKRTIERYQTSVAGMGSPRRLTEKRTFDVASNPEFLQEAKAVDGFFHPERIVCGVESKFAQSIFQELYSPFSCPIVFTDLTTAELIKHSANAFLATKISFINLVSDLCECVGGDVNKVAEGIGLDSRIGRAFLNPGLGFGGYCLPKDLRAFIYLMRQHGIDPGLLQATERINDRRVDHVVDRIRESLWVLEGKTVAVLGLAFKAGTDDVRESQSLKIVRRLLADGAKVRMYDPQANGNAELALGPASADQAFFKNAYEAATGADAVVVLTEWPEFASLDLRQLHSKMEVPLIIDSRNVLDAEAARAIGFEYHCIGKQPGSPNFAARGLSSNPDEIAA